METETVNVFLTHSGEGCMHFIGGVRPGSMNRIAVLLASGRVPKRWQKDHAFALVACSEGKVGYFIGDHVHVYDGKVENIAGD